MGIPVIIDNTFDENFFYIIDYVYTVYLIGPIEHGADIVVHSTTKWVGGHGITIGGKYLMEANFHGIMKDSNFTNPSPDCHGLIYWDTFGYNAFTIKARSEIMRNIEPCQNPFEFFLLIQGFETLSLLGKRKLLKSVTLIYSYSTIESPSLHDVLWVSYPGLESHPNQHPYHENAIYVECFWIHFCFWY
ncbi:hypothetical protein RhiirA4_505337 [Rhizophagus irregularis]|uniref:PLP-dependent transferase n=1 Tax=Rhizophagus irregularis TaxID=588596 RepID=A0A2I1G705_9GLOM|nr:hypothetical protein RhiirA4_505337 [Rhizophagus irregularis]